MQIRETLSSFLQFINYEHQVIYNGPIGQNYPPSDLLEEKRLFQFFSAEANDEIRLTPLSTPLTISAEMNSPAVQVIVQCIRGELGTQEKRLNYT